MHHSVALQFCNRRNKVFMFHPLSRKWSFLITTSYFKKHSWIPIVRFFKVGTWGVPIMLSNLFKIIFELKKKRVVFEKNYKYNFINTNSWHVAQWVSRDMSDAPPPSANLKKSDYSRACFYGDVTRYILVTQKEIRHNLNSYVNLTSVFALVDNKNICYIR